MPPPPSTRAIARLSGEQLSLEFQGAPPGEVRAGSTWRLGLSGPNVLLLQRVGGPPPRYFAGTLNSLSLGELFGHLLAGVRSGRLYVASGDVQKQVMLKDGQVIFAISSEPYERLGAAVVRLGLLAEEQLQEALEGVTPTARLGAVLTQREMITSAELYSAMSFLVREVVVNLFEISEGEFLFIEGEPATADAVKLPERTRDLVLEGIRRAEEVDRLRRRWPGTTCVRRGRPPSEGTRGEEGRAGELLATLTEGEPLAALRTRFEGSEHAFLTLADELFTDGTLLQERPRAAESAAKATSRGPVMEMYQTFLRHVASALAATGKDLAALRAYLQEPGPKLKAAFEAVALTDEGDLDVDQLERNVVDEDEALQRARMYETMDALVAYILFYIQNALPKEEAAPLQAEARSIRGEDV